MQAAGITLRVHQFACYHQRWLADHVQTEEEESCEQWLLQHSPEVATVKKAEEYKPGRVRYRYTTGVGLPTKVETACMHMLCMCTSIMYSLPSNAAIGDNQSCI